MLVTLDCLGAEFFNASGSGYPACMTYLLRTAATFTVLVFLLSVAPLLTATQAPSPVRKSCEDGVSLRATAGVARQGSLLLTQVIVPNDVTQLTSEWDGRAAPLWREQDKSGVLHGLLGVDSEKAPGQYEWKVSWVGPSSATASCSVTITVRYGKFATERLSVEQKFVQPDPEQEKRAEEDQKKMRAIYETITPQRLWDGKFQFPLKGVTTGGNFGRRRILNGQARAPHAGVDFPAAAGTPVFASQSGKVMLAEDLYYSGNTVVIDHGYGIFTMYCHLSEIGVTAGEMVKVGEEIGKVGATGRVTGPHLHWGLTIDHARVNAVQIAQRQP